MDADDVVVRPASWDDRAAILALTLEMGGHDDVAQHDDPMRRLGAALGRPDTRVLVAQRDGAIVGYAEVQARASSVSDRIEAWLGALAVAPTARRSGIGEALIGAVEREATLLGCDAIVLESSHWRDDAHAFYRERGFTERAPAARFVRAIARSAECEPIEDRFLAAAARAASAVASAVAGLRDATPVGMGADGAATEAADAAAEAAALHELATVGCAIVSEERGLVGTLPAGGDYWIALDPLDGSRNFRAGYPPYAMAAGLVRDGRPVAGYVADLTSGRRWWAARDVAFVDGRVARTRRTPLGIVPSPESASVPIPAVAGVARVRASGSTAIDLCRVADGSAAVFVAVARAVAHAHDLAGAMAVVTAAGGTVLDEDGAPPCLAPDPARTYRIVAAADAELALENLAVMKKLAL